MNAINLPARINRRSVEDVINWRNNPAMTKPAQNAVGKVINARLKAMKKTQLWLAEQTGVSNTAVHKWVHTGNIARDSAIAVAMALDISVDELYGTAPVKELAKEELDLDWITSEERTLLTLYRQCNATGKEMIQITARGAPKDAARAAPAKSAA